MFEHLDFLVWMLGFPFMDSLAKYFEAKVRPPATYSSNIMGISAILLLSMYLYIGYKLF